MHYRVMIMSKIWDSKKRILDMLSAKKMTLTEISDKLGLAPSTVNQHIRELLNAGAIRQVYNPFILKWKYYEANPDFEGVAAAVRRPATNFMANPLAKALPILVIIAVAAFILLGASGTSLTNAVYAQQSLAPGSVPQGLTVFSLSDAPAVSSISAVNISVSSAYVHSTTTGKWYIIFSSNTPKTFDLVKLRNVSAVLSGANLPAGTYDEITLEISNASAVVNNQSEPVFLPSGDIRIFGKFVMGSTANTSSSNTSTSSAMNGSASNTIDWVNLDFNLSMSVHITGDGKVVLLPVIDLNGHVNAQLNVSANGTIEAHKRGNTAAHEVVGMDEHGDMSENTRVPLNASITVNANSGDDTHAMVTIVSNQHISPHATPIVIRTDENLVVITNVINLTSIVSGLNGSANSTIRVVGHQNHGDGSINCTSVNGTISCQARGEIGAGELGHIIEGNAGAGFGIGT